MEPGSQGLDPPHLGWVRPLPTRRCRYTPGVAATPRTLESARVETDCGHRVSSFIGVAAESGYNEEETSGPFGGDDAEDRTLRFVGSRMALVRSKREAIREVAARYHASAVAVFGSVARGEDTPASDIDFLVQFDAGASLTDLIRLQEDLTVLLGCSVDVVSVGGLKDRDEHIRREAVAV